MFVMVTGKGIMEGAAVRPVTVNSQETMTTILAFITSYDA
jgi:hypothetical protein